MNTEKPRSSFSIWSLVHEIFRRFMDRDNTQSQTASNVDLVGIRGTETIVQANSIKDIYHYSPELMEAVLKLPLPIEDNE